MIAVVFIFPNTNDLDLTGLKSISNQTKVDFKIIISTFDTVKLKEYLIIENIFDLSGIVILDLVSYNTYSHIINFLTDQYDAEFIIFHENNISSKPNRILNQLSYISNTNLPIISCLADLNSDSLMPTEYCSFENTFISSSKIDSGFLGYFIPLTLSSLLIKLDYLEKIINYIEEDILLIDSVSFILFLVKFSSISKLSEPLITYNSFSGYTDYSAKLNIFNLSKTIERRSYLVASIEDISYKIQSTTEKSLKVLMLLDKANLGGTEMYVYSLIKSLLLFGIDVVIASISGITYPIIKNLDIDFIKLDYAINVSIEILENYLSNNEVHLIHSHLENSMLIGKFLKLKYNIPYVITLHGLFYNKELLINTCTIANSIISVSKPVDCYIKELIPSFPINNLFIVNNGIELKYKTFENIKEKLSLKPTAKLIIYCSRLGVGKGILAINVINSLGNLLKESPDVNLIIIGEGHSKFEIQNISDKFNSKINRNAIICVGATYNVKDYYNQSVAVIGTGRVLMEALSVGATSIAYGLNGLIGILTPHNRDKFLDCHFGDHKFIDCTEDRTLEEMIIYIINNENKFKDFSESNKLWCINNFNEINNTNRIIDIYNFSLNTS